MCKTLIRLGESPTYYIAHNKPDEEIYNSFIRDNLAKGIYDVFTADIAMDAIKRGYSEEWLTKRRNSNLENFVIIDIDWDVISNHLIPKSEDAMGDPAM